MACTRARGCPPRQPATVTSTPSARVLVWVSAVVAVMSMRLAVTVVKGAYCGIGATIVPSNCSSSGCQSINVVTNPSRNVRMAACRSCSCGRCGWCSAVWQFRTGVVCVSDRRQVFHCWAMAASSPCGLWIVMCYNAQGAYAAQSYETACSTPGTNNGAETRTQIRCRLARAGRMKRSRRCGLELGCPCSGCSPVRF